jgi:hypothetical protein
VTKLIYLDSNDFSDLSRTEDRLEESDKAILGFLRNARHAGTARFPISPVHICEAVHASENSKEDAMRRASLMRELGGDNLVRLPTNICKLELSRAFANQSTVACAFSEILSGSNEWFGAHVPDDLSDRRKEVDEAIENALSRLNRHERRRRRSELNPKKKSNHPTIRSLVRDGVRNLPPNKIPIAQLINPDLVLDWYLGIVSDAEFRENSLKIARDPFLLFKYFIDEFGYREKLYGLVRDQGLKWCEIIERGMAQCAPIFARAKQHGHQISSKELIAQITGDSFWRQVIGSLAGINLESLTGNQIEEIKERSPSTAIFIRAVLGTLLVRLQSTQVRAEAGNLAPASAKRSDYGDFMHAIYAPYVDVFRCDAAFGETIKTHPAVKGKIISKRKHLLTLF